MCLMQHDHIPHHAYKTNLSVSAGLSKTHTHTHYNKLFADAGDCLHPNTREVTAQMGLPSGQTLSPEPISLFHANATCDTCHCGARRLN